MTFIITEQGVGNYSEFYICMYVCVSVVSERRLKLSGKSFALRTCYKKVVKWHLKVTPDDGST